ncbi:unnamed protein product [Caenorhabditis bovis]|uniref:Uncharacterized protein n=1 Tax=Caenorhabditis bovis TaxID=2654633 RepID=A0A8S1EUE4_9PELO|nr:unnamed protein product [Caenorhabditis bovis]
MELFELEPLLLVNSYLMSLFGFLSNLVCLYFIITVKTEEMRNFRCLLLIYTFCDVIYTILHSIVHPSFALTNNVYVFFSYRDWNSVVHGRIMLTIFGYVFIQSISIQMILFVYRFWTISYYVFPKFYQIPFKKLWITLIIVIVPLIYISFPIYSLWGNPGVSKIELDEVQARIVTQKQHFAQFSAKVDGSGADYHTVIAAFFVSCLLILIESCVIVVCTIILARLTTASYMSLRTRRIHRQLLIYLVTQTSVTLACTAIQVGLFVISAALNVSLSLFGTLSTGLLAWFPVLDAVILLTCVSTYRLVALRKILGKKNSGPKKMRSFSISLQNTENAICDANMT